MGKTYEELMAELSPARCKRIESRAVELIAEEKSLRDLRQARHLTQQSMAKKLGVKQHSISRLEQRSDMLLSTLRDYIGKMGGELELIARFLLNERQKKMVALLVAGEKLTSRRCEEEFGITRDTAVRDFKERLGACPLHRSARSSP
jgi:transcriptional regulator with XRE-family HTH domain